MLFEAIAGIDAAHAGVGQEHRLVAQFFAGLGDADGIQRRAEGGLREECDGFLV